ncbi:uncharacterized protein J8A68_005160 [[Candida] subhashii]|uniref:Uncharacterized protein n=1 Tax=[Candida] subhashii TaxID=561895 RepID=A0A8J5UEQ1_9ASCO|nr:uncharacterized protein J8A68_005160 [[Candida] subhashii]KAG7661368.1 hypothetical protein J8A68_005160 [[Candida] subhashii]
MPHSNGSNNSNELPSYEATMEVSINHLLLLTMANSNRSHQDGGLPSYDETMLASIRHVLRSTVPNSRVQSIADAANLSRETQPRTSRRHAHIWESTNRRSEPDRISCTLLVIVTCLMIMALLPLECKIADFLIHAFSRPVYF